MREGLTPDDRRLIAAIDDRGDELTGLLAALVRAPSVNPPGDTRAAAAVAVDYLARWGIKCRLEAASPERPSVLAEYAPGADRAGGRAPCLLFLSHLDTVPLGDPDAWSADPFGAEVRAGRLWGRGASDAKGSVAAMLLALRVLIEQAPTLSGRVAVALVADEETGGAGARHLLDAGLLDADAVVVGETTDNAVAIAEKGVAWLRLVTQGRTAHASVPHAGINAATHLVRWLERIEREVVARLGERQHRWLSPPSLTLTSLAGGVAPNVVPDRGEAMLDRRTLPHETLDDVCAELLAVADALPLPHPDLRVSVEPVVWADAFETAPDAPIVRAALAARRALDLPAAPVGYQQASDGRFFGARGIPTVILGPGVAEGTHVPDESVSLAQVLEAARLHALTACRFLRLAGE